MKGIVFNTLGRRQQRLKLSPSPDWDGTATSGFDGSYGATPSDPARTTAKPAAKVLEPAYQRFTDTLTIGLIAFAIDNGSLINGINYVRAHCEGNTVDIFEMSFRTLTREDGSTYECLGYWVDLARNSAIEGYANVWYEIVATDATMQKRVLGPFVYGLFDTEHDWSATVGAVGADYDDIRTALNAARSAAAAAPLIELIDSTDYDVGDVNPLSYTPTLATTIAAADGVKPRIVRPVDNVGEWRPRHLRMWIIGVEFDLSTISQLRGETNSIFFTKRCRFARPGGRALFFSGLTGPSYFTDNAPFQMENYYFGAYQIGNSSELMRGNTALELYGDFADRVQCAVHNIVDDLQDNNLAGTRDALTITYGGAGTAYVSGTNGGSGADTFRDFEFWVDTGGGQVSVGSFAAWESWVHKDDGDNLYSMQDLVDYINTLPDWGATLLDGNLKAYYATDPTNVGGFSGNDFPTPIAIGAGLTLIASIGLHQDGLAHYPGSSNNVVLFANRITTGEGQLHYLAGSNNDATDFYSTGNLFEQIAGSNLVSNMDQFSSAASNVVILHNTWSRQVVEYDISASSDPYNTFSNNVADMIRGDAGVATGDNNHVQSDGSGSPATGFTNTVTAGTRATLYVDADNFDFTAAGELASNPKTSIARYDQAGERRDAIGPVGAYGGIDPGPITFGGTAAAPSVTSSSILGTAEHGQTLTAHVIRAGNPTPTITYQWQKNGANISGETSKTITLDASAMSLADGDTISCEITLTSTEGSVVGEPTIAYVGVAAALSSASISGSPQDGEVLTASYTATGDPTITATYQWQNNGVDISGETSSTITLDKTGMGLSDGDTISCEISVSNNSGSDASEPTTTFVDGATNLDTLQALLAGDSFAIDLTTAVDGTDFTSTDSSGLGNTLGQTVNSREPTVSGTLGAVFDAIGNDEIRDTISAGTYTVIMTMVCDPTNTDQTFLSNDGSADSIRATSGNGTALPATVTVDGASVTTRGELFTAAAINSEVTVVVTGYTLTGATTFLLGSTSTSIFGSVRRIVRIDEGSVTGADLTDARTAGIGWTEES